MVEESREALKAASEQIDGDNVKAKHNTISTAAALINYFMVFYVRFAVVVSTAKKKPAQM